MKNFWKIDRKQTMKQINFVKSELIIGINH